MNTRRTLVASLPLMLASSAGLAQTQWINVAGGVWNDALNWDPADVPASPGETAHIGLAGIYTVGLQAVSPDIDALVLTNPDATLAINGARTLRTAALTNDGIIVINANNSASAARVLFSADTTIAGAGVILLNRTGSTARLETDAGVTATNGPAHTIAGHGEITAALINEGRIVAGEAGKSLRLRDGGIANNALVEAVNAGELVLLTVDLTQGPAGVVRADGGAVVFDPGDVQTITGGALETINGGTMTREFSGSLTLVDVTNRGRLDIQGAGTVAVGGAGLTNEGLLVVNSNNSASAAKVNFDQDGELTGAGTLRLNRIGATAILSTSPGVTVTNAAGHTIDGLGQIDADLINDGLVDANVDGQDIRLRDQPKHNNATMRATGGGGLRLFDATISQSPTGVLLADGGRVVFDAGDTHKVAGGRLESTGGGTITREFSGTTTLHDVTLDGQLDIQAAGAVAIEGAGLINNGVVVVNSNNNSSPATLRFDQDGALMGPGVVRLSRTGGTALLDTAPGVTATNGTDHTIEGLGQIDAALINDGLVVANVPGEELRLRDQPKTNNSVIAATNGGSIVLLDPTVTQSPAGVLLADGGDIVFDAGDSHTIIGGALATANGGVVLREFSGITTLENVTNTGRFEIQGAGSVDISGAGITNDGLLVVNSNNSASAATLRVRGGGTVGGSGEVRLNRSTGTSLLVAEPDTTATIGPDQTVRGDGKLDGNMRVQGTLSPGLPIGSLLAEGGVLDLEPAALLEIEAESPAAFDQVTGTSEFHAGGTLRLTPVGGYAPLPGDVLVIVEADAVVGEFDALDLPPVGGGYQWRVRYEADEIALVLSCAADFNIDGAVNTLDVLAFLNAWAAGEPSADINADGTVNTLDVLAFLNLWAAGC